MGLDLLTPIDPQLYDLLFSYIPCTRLELVFDGSRSLSCFASWYPTH